MSLESSFQIPAEQPKPSRAGKLWSLVRVVENWPRTLADHLGLTRADYVCRLRNGLEFFVRGGTDDRHVIFEIFAEPIYPVRLGPDSVVVDIGAQIGCFSLLAAQRGARVLSFEPFPANFAALTRNLELNRGAHVRPFRAAVTGKSETRQMFLPDDGGHTGRFSLHPGRGSKTVDTQCLSLDEVIADNDLTGVDLLKVDCQGSEYEILYGTRASTFERIRAIIVECEIFDAPAHWSIAALQRHLEQVGYETARQDNILYAARSEAA